MALEIGEPRVEPMQPGDPVRDLGAPRGDERPDCAGSP
jgi:hypothetical protein